MKPAPASNIDDPRVRGLAFGLIGVIAFSITLPATRLAVGSFHPLFVGLGRELVAACLAAPLLYFTRQVRPTGSQLRGLSLVVLSLIIGFPTLSAWAMQRVDASHGAVVLGLLPAATAVAGFLRAHERPSFGFWCASAVGSCTVIAFALAAGGGEFRGADLALLGSVVCAALGYAEGGRLGREMGGWQVICWALVLGLPLLVPSVAWLVWQHGLIATPAAWTGFAYVSVVSAFLAFFAWYHGLAIGGVARVGQLQLLQPFFTLAFAAIFLGERFGFGAILCATLVTLSIFAARKSTVTDLSPSVAIFVDRTSHP
jgi:drug/metabolite transporter (DMT)-like permease